MNGAADYAPPSEKIAAWAATILRPAAARYEADGETQLSVPVIGSARSARVMPTEILVRDAIERYVKQMSDVPTAVALSPLRYLSLAGYAETGYPYSGHAVPLVIRRGVGSDEARALSPRETQELETV